MQRKKFLEKNVAHVQGVIVNEITFSHQVLDRKMYKTELVTKRESGVRDTIPIIIPEELLDIMALQDYTGKKVKIIGNFRSIPIKGEDKKIHEKLYVFPQKFDVINNEEEELTSKVILRGKIFKKKVIMQSSQNKFILIFKLAIKRVNGKIDYIPCVAWNDIAKAISAMDTGTQIKVIGRIQSQEYSSKNPNDFDETITKTVFKLAVWKLYSEE